MRLSIYDKDVFVSAVMASVPELDGAVEGPKVQAAIVKAMSPAIRKVYKESPKALRTDAEYIGRERVVFFVGDVVFRDVYAPWRQKIDARDQLRRTIKATTQGCNTLKQLKERLPELTQYMPDAVPAPTAGVPAVISVLADMKALGWVA